MKKYDVTFTQIVKYTFDITVELDEKKFKTQKERENYFWSLFPENPEWDLHDEDTTIDYTEIGETT